jgi:uncharacterized protein (TIRG00374 family)
MSANTDSPDPPGTLEHGHRPATTVWASLTALALLAGAAWALYAERATISEGLRSLRHLDPFWVGAAAAAQVASMVAFALQQQSLFRVLGGRRPGFARLLSTAYLANAINFAVPFVGSGMATRYAYRQFRRVGIERSAATFALTLSGVVSTVAFAVVIVIAGLMSGNPTVAAGSILASLAATATIASILVSARSSRGRDLLADLANEVMRVPRTIVHRPRADPQPKVRAILDRLGAQRLSVIPLGSSFGFSLLNWLADAACLVFAIRSVGAPVRLGRVLLVWAAGLGAQSVSPTPGGIGTVEVTMTAALVAVGLHPPEAVAAVIVYRVIGSKFVVAIGWALVRAVRKPFPQRARKSRGQDEPHLFRGRV